MCNCICLSLAPAEPGSPQPEGSNGQRAEEAWGLGLSTGCIPAHISVPSTFPCFPSETPGARPKLLEGAGASVGRAGRQHSALLPVHALTCCSACPRWGWAPCPFPSLCSPQPCRWGPEQPGWLRRGLRDTWGALCASCLPVRFPPVPVSNELSAGAGFLRSSRVDERQPCRAEDGCRVRPGLHLFTQHRQG